MTVIMIMRMAAPPPVFRRGTLSFVSAAADFGVMPSVFEPSGSNNKNNSSYSRASTNNSNNDQEDTPAGILTRDSVLAAADFGVMPSVFEPSGYNNHYYYCYCYCCYGAHTSHTYNIRIILIIIIIDFHCGGLRSHALCLRTVWVR